MVAKFIRMLTAFAVAFGSLPLTVSAQDSKGKAYDTCKSLAADPFDPRSSGLGVPFELIIGAKAIAACEEAIAASPEDALLKYWALRAYLAVGLDEDEDLIKALTHYLSLRKSGEHELALYYMSLNDDEIRDAVKRHTKNIKKRFYWCEREFCGFQIYDDLVALSKTKNVRFMTYFSQRGYVPAVKRMVSALCGHNSFSTGSFYNDVIKHYYEEFKKGDAFAEYFFAYSFYKNVAIETDKPSHLHQNCGPRIKLPDIEKYILPALKKYSMKTYFMEDFSPLIAAIEHDLEQNSLSKSYLTAIDAIQTKISGGEKLTADDVAFVQKVVNDQIEPSFFKKDKVLAMAKNLYGLMSLYGIGVSKDVDEAIAIWYGVAEENKYYSVSSIFNLLSNSSLLNAEKREYLLFKVHSTEIMSGKERLAYVSYIIEQPEFENVLANDLNGRARSVILIDVGGKQLHGTGVAPPNATPVERMYEYLAAESISRDRNAKLAIFAAVVAGLAVVGALAGDAPATEPSKPDRCAGFNGLGWVDDTLGNAAAFFGCQKY